VLGTEDERTGGGDTNKGGLSGRNAGPGKTEKDAAVGSERRKAIVPTVKGDLSIFPRESGGVTVDTQWFGRATKGLWRKVALVPISSSSIGKKGHPKKRTWGKGEGGKEPCLLRCRRTGAGSCNLWGNLW